MLLDNHTTCGTPLSDLAESSSKRVRYECDSCNEEKQTTYQSYNKGQKRNGYTRMTLCQPCASAANNWNGGIRMTDDGYRDIRIAKGKYKREHRLVLEQVLERELTPQEIVHHIDGDKLNNQLENLALCPSKSEHQRAHYSLESIGMSLYRAGLVRYCHETNTYYVAHLKLRELLEHPEEDNQQPNPEGDFKEGSTTSENVVYDHMNHHERGAPKDNSL